MKTHTLRNAAVLLVLLVNAVACTSVSAAVNLPSPAVDEPLATAKGERTAVVAGGCFWGIEAVFDHVKGVKSAVSGYSGGAAGTAQYETVSTGTTGHAESVKITYDPSQISYGQLLKIYFSVATDPTELNRQGNSERPRPSRGRSSRRSCR
jgi:peptide-methionine (S)-S-oxide reductase